ncbi:hypothetical protein B0H14DRAFT_3867393 [Mycena olivaceomarginata]|nr:hypothetical protein B0H14DRAFT_3867393 [Mycena olivaceomarginata]
MEPFNLPMLDGLYLIEGLCNGLHLTEGLCDGTLLHTAILGFHGVNVRSAESRNKSMVVHIANPHEGHAPKAVACEIVGQRTFVGWPFLQEGQHHRRVQHVVHRKSFWARACAPPTSTLAFPLIGTSADLPRCATCVPVPIAGASEKEAGAAAPRMRSH